MNDELRLGRIGVVMLGVKDMARSVESTETGSV